MLHKSYSHSDHYTEDIYRSLQLSRSICAYIDQRGLSAPTNSPHLRSFVRAFTRRTKTLKACFVDNRCDYDLHKTMRTAFEIRYTGKRQKNRVVAFWRENLFLNKLRWSLSDRSEHIRNRSSRRLSSDRAIAMFDEYEYLESYDSRVRLAMEFCAGETLPNGYRVAEEWSHFWYRRNVAYIDVEREYWSRESSSRSVSDVQVIWQRSDQLRRKACDSLDMLPFVDGVRLLALLMSVGRNLNAYGSDLAVEQRRLRDVVNSTRFGDAYAYGSATDFPAKSFAGEVLQRYAYEFHRLASEVSLYASDRQVAYVGMRDLANTARKHIRALQDRRNSFLADELRSFHLTCRRRPSKASDKRFNGPSIPTPEYNGTRDSINKTIVVSARNVTDPLEGVDTGKQNETSSTTMLSANNQTNSVETSQAHTWYKTTPNSGINGASATTKLSSENNQSTNDGESTGSSATIETHSSTLITNVETVSGSLNRSSTKLIDENSKTQTVESSGSGDWEDNTTEWHLTTDQTASGGGPAYSGDSSNGVTGGGPEYSGDSSNGVTGVLSGHRTLPHHKNRTSTSVANQDEDTSAYESSKQSFTTDSDNDAPSTTTSAPTFAPSIPINKHCLFPFVYNQLMYMDCVLVRGIPKCGTKNYKNGTYKMAGCSPKPEKPEPEVTTRQFTIYSWYLVIVNSFIF